MCSLIKCSVKENVQLRLLFAGLRPPGEGGRKRRIADSKIKAARRLQRMPQCPREPLEPLLLVSLPRPRGFCRAYIQPCRSPATLRVCSRMPSGWQQTRDATFILRAFRHGLRVSELVGLRLDAVDWAGGDLHVARVKNSTPSTHPIRGAELRALRQLRRADFRVLPPRTTDNLAMDVETAGLTSCPWNRGKVTALGSVAQSGCKPESASTISALSAVLAAATGPVANGSFRHTFQQAVLPQLAYSVEKLHARSWPEMSKALERPRFE
jgi:integrase